MRFLFIDANYPEFLDGVYETTPELIRAPYADQLASIRDGLFGEAFFQASALIALGHEADVVVTNADLAQRRWAGENGFGRLLGRRRKFRWRRGFVPWWSASSDGASWPVVFEQVKAYRPDVLYVEIMNTLPPDVARHLCTLARFTVAQVATDLPPSAHRKYDLVVSSIPVMVDEFRRTGIDAEWLPLAFEPKVLKLVGSMDRDVAVSFVGSFSSAYADRMQIVEAVARVAPLQTWTRNTDQLNEDSKAWKTVRGAAFGRDMYQVLARSRITLNSHGTVSGRDANNLRLYEATGMGALLVTDARSNLGDLFEIGREVVTFASPGEAAELVRYYVDHEEEALSIAAAGQARTLREHTWTDRMARVVESIAVRI